MVNNLISELQAIAAAWPTTADKTAAARGVRERLERLYELGWDDALGEQHEIPDEQLPPRYLARRAAILEALQNRLSELARKYRRSPAGSAERQDVVAEYHRQLAERCRIGHLQHLEPDEELPDADMPRFYAEYWARH